MSAISNVHNVVAFDSKTAKPFEGQRLSKVVYKQTEEMKKKGETKKASVCVSIPVISQLDAAMVNSMNPYIVSLYHEAQDGIIRGLVEAGKTQITDTDIGNDAVLAYLAEEAAGDRLKSEAVQEWFDSSMADMLKVAFADKMGVSDTPSQEQEKVIAQAVGVYREKFAKLAGGKTSYDKDTAIKLLKALEITEANDKIGQRFNVRLTKMVNAPTGADMFGL